VKKELYTLDGQFFVLFFMNSSISFERLSTTRISSFLVLMDSSWMILSAWLRLSDIVSYFVDISWKFLFMSCRIPLISFLVVPNPSLI